MKSLIVLSVVCLSAALADVSHILNTDPYQAPYETHDYSETTTTTTPPPPPHPYEFNYTAGRYPGHVDRSHSEKSDGSGTVVGKFSYVDPRQELRTVEYVADQDGFHPQLSHGPQFTDAVNRAAERHFKLFNRIAEIHSNPEISLLPENLPKDSVAVAKAKDRHYNLFDKIVQEHARIAEEHAALRAAFEATSEINEVADEQQHY